MVATLYHCGKGRGEERKKKDPSAKANKVGKEEKKR
jgi:hypothetical protein